MGFLACVGRLGEGRIGRACARVGLFGGRSAESRAKFFRVSPQGAICCQIVTERRKTVRRPATILSEMLSIDWHQALAEHDRWLRTVVAARVGERAAIDEVMQEVSLAAIRQQAPLVDPAKVAPWLYRLAVTQSLLFRRKAGRRRRLRERFISERRPTEADAGAVDPLSWMVARERQEMVRAAMARLPGRDEEMLMLKYSEGWSYRQISEHLGISESAVEARLHRARMKLRAELASLEPRTLEVERAKNMRPACR